MNLEERGYRVVEGGLADEATIAARSSKRPPDHDAGMRQARTRMGASRAKLPWGWTDTVRAGVHVSLDDDVDSELLAMNRVNRDRLEAIAQTTRRTYDQVVARRRRLRTWSRQWHALADDPDAPAPPMPYGWR